MGNQKAVHIYFSGRVQGIGFRYTARSLAATYNMVGWVRNLTDGKVELLVQGEENDIKQFLADLRDNFSGFITSQQESSQSIDSKLVSFDIKFY